MAKYRVTVQATVVVTYDTVTIEADDREAAEALAEHDRFQGALGTPTETVENVDYYFEECGDVHSEQ